MLICSGVQTGVTLHQRLYIFSRPIVYKYREGKVKSTLYEGLKGPEIVANECERMGIAAWLVQCFAFELRVACDQAHFHSVTPLAL